MRCIMQTTMQVYSLYLMMVYWQIYRKLGKHRISPLSTILQPTLRCHNPVTIVNHTSRDVVVSQAYWNSAKSNLCQSLPWSFCYLAGFQSQGGFSNIGLHNQQSAPKWVQRIYTSLVEMSAMSLYSESLPVGGQSCTRSLHMAESALLLSSEH